MHIRNMEQRGPRIGEFPCWHHKKVTRCKVYKVFGGKKKHNVLCSIEGSEKRYRLESYLINFNNSPDWETNLMKRFERERERQLQLRIEYERAAEEARKIEELRRNAAKKNQQLSVLLHKKREDMCGIGTRKVKLFLNSLVRKGDKVAELYRMALEAEDFNIKAKESTPYYKDRVYAQKHGCIQKLMELCKAEGVKFGWQASDVRKTNSVVYFELPGMEQISFHSDFTKSEKEAIPKYRREWDGKVMSTLGKIEDAILGKYGEEIEKKYSVKSTAE